MSRPVFWLLGSIMKWCYNKYHLQAYEGICICDIASSSDEQSRLFLARTIEALELVKTHDTRRFHRLQRHLHYIINLQMLRPGSYDSNLHVCNIDYSRIRDTEDEAWEVLMLAATFVHEATHGVLYSRGIAYDKKHRLAIEQLCHQEEVRFIRRLSPEAGLSIFDEAEYIAYFQASRWRLVFNGMKHSWRPK